MYSLYDTGLHEIRSMSSFISTSSFHIELGSKIVKTKDMFDCPGSILLVHPDKATLQADYDRIRALEHDGLFDIVHDTIPRMMDDNIKTTVAAAADGCMTTSRKVRHIDL